MNNIILEFSNISKSYSTIRALENISFSIPENSIFGILGANGSGKSTFMKILPGLIKKWHGEIIYNGLPINKNNNTLRKEFGYLIESPTFYEYISARKNLEILARISDVKYDKINYVLELVELTNRANDKVQSYSYGMKQRLGIAQALIHDPKVLVLDEPNNGLDPNGIDDMIKLIKKLQSDGKTICLSTHNLVDVEKICTHFTVFTNGVSSSTNSMQNQFQRSNKWIINVDKLDDAIKTIKEQSSFKFINEHNNNIVIESSIENPISKINKLLEKFIINKISKESNLIEYFENT